MNKLISNLLIISLSVVFFTSCGADGAFKGFFAGSSQNEKFEAKEYQLPEQIYYSKEARGFIYDKFFPIGWSSDGKFAYVQQLANEACGCTWIFFRIYDTETQQTIKEIEFNDHGSGETYETVWTKIYDEAKKHMHTYKIVQYFKFDIHSTKFGTENINYELVMRTERFADPEYAIEFVKKTNIELRKRQTEVKSVGEIAYNPPYYVLDASIAGILLSPNGLYGCILYKEEKIGYEGPPQVIGFLPIGVAF